MLYFQQSYAAKDSQAGLAVFLCLVSLKLHSTEEYDSLTFLLTDIQRRSVPMCHGIVDLHYKQNPVSQILWILFNIFTQLCKLLFCSLTNNNSDSYYLFQAKFLEPFY